jgi:hypothetical protein
MTGVSKSLVAIYPPSVLPEGRKKPQDATRPRIPRLRGLRSGSRVVLFRAVESELYVLDPSAMVGMTGATPPRVPRLRGLRSGRVESILREPQDGE